MLVKQLKQSLVVTEPSDCASISAKRVFVMDTLPNAMAELKPAETKDSSHNWRE